MLLCSAACCLLRATEPDVRNLRDAIARGDAARVRTLAATPAGARHLKDQGGGVLHEAIFNLQYHLLPVLLGLGASPLQDGGREETPLVLAVKDGAIAAVDALIQAGAPFHPDDPGASIAYRHALISGHSEMVRRFLDHGFPAVHPFHSYDEDCPALVFASSGSTEVVQMLLNLGADVNTAGTWGGIEYTPLMSAASGNHLRILNLLLKKGADPGRATADGDTALSRAGRNQAVDTYARLLAIQAAIPIQTSRPWLPSVWSMGRLDLIDTTLSHAPHLPRLPPADALLRAVLAGDISAVKELILYHTPKWEGAGALPLCAAAAHGSNALLEAFHGAADRGAWFKVTDHAGHTQLHHAVMAGNTDAIAFFGRYNGPIDKPDPQGRTPLMLAAQLGNNAAASALLEAKAAVNQADTLGRTALDYAEAHHHAATAALLKQAGAVSTLPALPPLAASPRGNRVPSPAETAAGASPTPLTAAMLAWDVSADGWPASRQAAADLAILLQARLADVTHITWVEREEINRVIAEWETNMQGWVSPASTLLLGRLLKADLILTGRISANMGAGREIEVLVIDTRNGAVLARRQALWQGPLSQPFVLDPGEAGQATDMARAALAAAGHRLQIIRQQPVIAPLSLSNTSRTGRRLDTILPQLTEVLHESARASDVHLIEFQHPSIALSETELALDAIVQLDSGSLPQVAGHYLWGEIEEIESGSHSFLQTPVRASLSLWSGGAAPAVFSTEATIATLGTAFQELADRLFASVKNQPPMTPESFQAERFNIARMLLAQALAAGPVSIETSVDFNQFNKPDWQAQWKHQCRLIEMARLFNPNDAEISAWYLLVRWHDRILSHSSLEVSAVQKFHDWMRRIQDWQRHYDRFADAGFDKIPLNWSTRDMFPASRGRTHAVLVRDSLAAVHTDLLSQIRNRGFDFLHALPPNELRALLEHLSRRTAAMFLESASQPFSHSLKEIYLGVLPVWSRHLDESLKLKIAPTLWRHLCLIHARFPSERHPHVVRQIRNEILPWYQDAGRIREGLALTGLESFTSAMQPAPAARTANTAPQPAAAAASTLRLLATHAEPVAWPQASSKYPTIKMAATIGGRHLLNFSHQDPNDGSRRTVLADWHPQRNQFQLLAPSPLLGNLLLHVLVGNGQSAFMGGSGGVFRIQPDREIFHEENVRTGLPFPTIHNAATLGGTTYFSAESKTPRVIMAWNQAKGWHLAPSPPGLQDSAHAAIHHLFSDDTHLWCYYSIDNLTRRLARYSPATGAWMTHPRFEAPKKSTLVCASADSTGAWLAFNSGVLHLPADESDPLWLPHQRDHRRGTGQSAWHDQDWLYFHLGQCTPALDPADHPDFSTEILVVDKKHRRLAGYLPVYAEGHPTGLCVSQTDLYPMGNKKYGRAAIMRIDRAALARELDSLPQ